MAKSSAPDPRFDPRFQRGYDGPEPAVLPTPAAPSPIEGSASAHAVPPAPADDADRTAAATADPVRAADAGAHDGFWTPPRRNPFALALLTAGLAMIAVGGWLAWTVVTASSFPDGYDRAAQTFSLVQQQLTPPLLSAGLLGVVGWLVLGALEASTRKRE